MALTDADIEAAVKKHVDAAEAARCEVHWDTALKAAGAMVPDGQGEREMPFDGYFVFVDLLPEANWGHPTLYLLVDAAGHRVEVAHRELPPYFEGYPATFRKLSLGAS